MHNLASLHPIDYLIIGHLAKDITPTGLRIGGTAAYSALTAAALGLKVGIVTAWGSEIPLGPLAQIPIINYPSDQSTTFENIYTANGRVQILHHIAPTLDFHLIPEPWRQAKIVHLGPIAQEVEPALVRRFPESLIGLTPQGWMRIWDDQGHVSVGEWPEASFVLQHAGAAILSIEDVLADEERIEEMASASKILVITEGKQGARVYWNGDVRRIRPPSVNEIDATGAGDIFATAYFARLQTTHDPWEAARFANYLAACSVTRKGMDSIPTADEIRESMVEVM